MADECNHRDVNHTFAEMNSDDPNPFLEKHKDNAKIAWRIHAEGEKTHVPLHNDPEVFEPHANNAMK
jgi:hypothetical protein